MKEREECEKKKGIVRAVFFIVPAKPPFLQPASSSSPSPLSPPLTHHSPVMHFIFFNK